MLYEVITSSSGEALPLIRRVSPTTGFSGDNSQLLTAAVAGEIVSRTRIKTEKEVIIKACPFCLLWRWIRITSYNVCYTKLLRRCHLFILPSFYEGLPLVLLEALASGCRIITTDLSGCRELLDAADPDLVEFVELPVLQEIDRPDPHA